MFGINVAARSKNVQNLIKENNPTIAVFVPNAHQPQEKKLPESTMVASRDKNDKWKVIIRSATLGNKLTIV